MQVPSNGFDDVQRSHQNDDAKGTKSELLMIQRRNECDRSRHARIKRVLLAISASASAHSNQACHPAAAKIGIRRRSSRRKDLLHIFADALCPLHACHCHVSICLPVISISLLDLSVSLTGRSALDLPLEYQTSGCHWCPLRD